MVFKAKNKRKSIVTKIEGKARKDVAKTGNDQQCDKPILQDGHDRT